MKRKVWENRALYAPISLVKHDPVEYQIIKQKQSNNHSIESHFTICHSASFSSQISITMKKK